MNASGIGWTRGTGRAGRCGEGRSPRGRGGGRARGRLPEGRPIARIKDLLESSSGIELQDVSNDTTFLEMGLDSLFLTQVAMSLQKKFGVKVTFRQLNEELPNLDRLADFLLEHGADGTTTEQTKAAPSTNGTATDATEDAPELKKVFGAQARIQKERRTT